ncbi:MAG: hypothetical protein ACM3RQ_00610 [Methanocella sp.]
MRSGQPLVARSVKGGWLSVGFLLGKEYKTGWVQASDVRLADTTQDIAGPSREACNTYSANPRLTSSVGRFKCREGILDEGFERCDIEISYQVSTACIPDGSMFRTVYCEATLRLTDADGMTSNRSFDERQPVYITGDTSGMLEIHARVSSLITPIVRARMTDASCRLEY